MTKKLTPAAQDHLDRGKQKAKADAASGAFKGLTCAGFNLHTEILVSSDPHDRGFLTDEEVKEMPQFWQELISTQRELNRELREDRDD